MHPFAFLASSLFNFQVSRHLPGKLILRGSRGAIYGPSRGRAEESNSRVAIGLVSPVAGLSTNPEGTTYHGFPAPSLVMGTLACRRFGYARPKGWAAANGRYVRNKQRREVWQGDKLDRNPRSSKDASGSGHLRLRSSKGHPRVGARQGGNGDTVKGFLPRCVGGICGV